MPADTALQELSPDGQHAVNCMADTLLLALAYTRDARAAGHDQVPADRLRLIHAGYDGAIQAIRIDNTPTRNPLHHKALILADRFAKHRDMILRFVHDLAVPFTNNEAERQIRGVKVKQRASGGWRTLDGLADFAIIWSTSPPPRNTDSNKSTS